MEGDNGENHTILSSILDYGHGNYGQIFLLNSNFAGEQETVGGLIGILQKNNLKVGFYTLQSGLSGGKGAYMLGVLQNWSHFAYSLLWNSIEPGFKDTYGYEAYQDLKGFDGSVSLYNEFKDKPIHKYNITLTENQDRDSLARDVIVGTSLSGWLITRNDTYFDLSYSDLHNGMFDENGNWDVFGDRTYSACVTTHNSDPLHGFSISENWGHYMGVSGYHVETFSMPICSTKKMRNSIWLQNVHYTSTTLQTVLTSTYVLTPERSINFRGVITGSNQDFYAAFRQSTRKGFEIYLTYGDPNVVKTENRVSLKLVKAF
jgi:hypothetical protein